MLLYDHYAFRNVPIDACDVQPSPAGNGSRFLAKSPASGKWLVIESATGRTVTNPERIEIAACLAADLKEARQAYEEAGAPLPSVREVRRALPQVREDYGMQIGGAHVDIAPVVWLVNPPLMEARDTVPTVVEGVDDPHALKAVFVVGAGGSGKSKVASAMFSGVGFKFLNPDVHLERMMKAEKEPLSRVGSRKDLFDKARDYRDVEFAQYAKRRLPVVFDITGWDYQRVAEPFQKLKKLGYDCYMVFVHTSLPTALRRNKARGEAGGRAVPEYGIEDAWRGVQRNLKNYIKLFRGRVFIVNNDKDMTAGTWDSAVLPKLKKIALKVLNRPVQNPVGREWLANQLTPGKSEYGKVGPGPKKGGVTKRRFGHDPESATLSMPSPAEKTGKPLKELFFATNPRAPRPPEPRPLPPTTKAKGNVQRGWMPKALYDKLKAPEKDVKESLDEDGGAEDRSAAAKLMPFIRKSPKLFKMYMFGVVRPIALYKAKGTFDREKSPLLARHLVVNAGRAYHNANGGGGVWHETFNQKTREAAEVMVRDAAEKDASGHKVDEMLPKKYRAGFKGYNKADEGVADDDAIQTEIVGASPRHRSAETGEDQSGNL